MKIVIFLIAWVSSVVLGRLDLPTNTSVNLLFRHLKPGCCIVNIEITQSSQNATLLSYEGSQNTFGTFRFGGTILSGPKKAVDNVNIYHSENEHHCYDHVKITSSEKEIFDISNSVEKSTNNPLHFLNYSPQNLNNINFCQNVDFSVEVQIPACERECWLYWREENTALEFRKDPTILRENEVCKFFFGRTITAVPILEFLKFRINDSEYPSIKVTNNTIKINWLNAKKFQCAKVMKSTKGTINVRIQTTDGGNMKETDLDTIDNFNTNTIQSDLKDLLVCFDLHISIGVQLSFECGKDGSCQNVEKIVFRRNQTASESINMSNFSMIFENNSMTIGVIDGNPACLNKTASIETIFTSDNVSFGKKYIQIIENKIQLENIQCVERAIKVKVSNLAGDHAETYWHFRPTIKEPINQENDAIHLAVSEPWTNCPRLMFEMKCSKASNDSMLIRERDGWNMPVNKIRKSFPNCVSLMARVYVEPFDKKPFSVDEHEEVWHTFQITFENEELLLRFLVPSITFLFILVLVISGCCAINPCKKKTKSSEVSKKIANFEKNENLLDNIDNHLAKDLSKELNSMNRKKTKAKSEDINLESILLHGFLPIITPRNDTIVQFWNFIVEKDIKTLVLLPNESKEEAIDNDESFKILPDKNNPELHPDESMNIKLKSSGKRNKAVRSGVVKFANSMRVKNKRPKRIPNISQKEVTITYGNQSNTKTLMVLKIENVNAETFANLINRLKATESSSPIGITGNKGIGAFIGLSKLCKDYVDPAVDQIKVYDTMREIYKDTKYGVKTEEEYKLLMRSLRGFVEEEVAKYGHVKANTSQGLEPPNTKCQKFKRIASIIFDLGCSIWAVVDVILDIKTTIFYHKSWQDRVLSKWFFIFSASAMLLPIIAIIVLLWSYVVFGIRTPTRQNYSAAVFLTFLAPLMWLAAPFMFLAVVFYESLDVASGPNLSTSRPIKRFILMALAIKCSEQCFEGFPQFLISAVYLGTNEANEGTTLLLVSCIFSAGSLVFFLFINIYKSVFSYKTSICGVLEQTLSRVHR